MNRNSHALLRFYDQLMPQHGIVGPVTFWMRGPPLHRAPIPKNKSPSIKDNSISSYFENMGEKSLPCVSLHVIETF